jgi:hypothetical protein
MPWPTFLTWPTSPLHKQGLKEALATRDAARDTLELLVLDNFSHKIYTWVGRSSTCGRKMNNLMDVFAQDPLVVPHFHEVRWLSRGQVMKQMGLCMTHEYFTSWPSFTQTLVSARNPF